MIDLSTTPVRGMNAGRIPLSYQFKRLFAPDARGPIIPPAERAITCDNSHWDGLTNYATMQVAGSKGCHFKASQGINLKDDQYDNSRRNCTNLPWGSYHFMTIADGKAQANYFCDTIVYQPGVFPPVLDVELATVAASVVRAFVTQVYARMYLWPIIYTSAYYWNLVVGASDKTWISERCKLWVAHYGTTSPLMPIGWTDYVLHQYSADGNNLGHTYGGQGDDMDLNYTRLSWLAQYAPLPLTIEQRVTALETQARAHGWAV